MSSYIYIFWFGKTKHNLTSSCTFSQQFLGVL